MSSSKITLIGLYNYDPTIFDNLTFPAGIVKEVAINEILLKSGEFEIVYPDPEFIKAMIAHWGTKNFRTFEKWIEALSLEFNPLYNFDRYEEYSDSRTRQDERNTTDNRTRSDTRDATDERIHSDIKAHSDSNSRNDSKEIVANSETLAETSSTTDDDTTDTKSVSAYDSNTYQPKEQDIINKDISTTNNDSSISSNQSRESTTGSESSNGNESTQGNESGKTTENTSGVESGNATESGKENELTQHNAHLFGNIGVTTSTQLLEDFLRVERFNIYEQIADIFITDFCVLVYE